MNRTTNVAPSNLKQVRPLISQRQGFSHLNGIFPSRGVVAVQQAVYRPLGLFLHHLIVRRVWSTTHEGHPQRCHPRGFQAIHGCK